MDECQSIDAMIKDVAEMLKNGETNDLLLLGALLLLADKEEFE